MEKYRYLLYGFGGLFLMGLGIRAVLVAACRGAAASGSVPSATRLHDRVQVQRCG